MTAAGRQPLGFAAFGAIVKCTVLKVTIFIPKLMVLGTRRLTSAFIASSKVDRRLLPDDTIKSITWLPAAILAVTGQL